MGLSKTDHFSDKQNRVAVIAKAFGHPARIAIVEHLLRVNACICNDIGDELPLAQPTISQHLRELKNAGLIKGNIEGNSICYCLNVVAFDTLQSFLQLFLQRLHKQECC